MRKAHMQSLRSLIRRFLSGLVLLPFCQRIPFLLFRGVPSNITHLHQDIQHLMLILDRQQNLVATRVVRLTIFSVYIRCNDIARLHKHVVQRRTHSSCADRVGVATVPGNLNSVLIGVAEQAREECVADPVRCLAAEGDGIDEEGEEPQFEIEAMIARSLKRSEKEL